MQQKRVQRLRLITQFIFLGLFLFLVFKGRVQLWLPIFGAGVLFSLFFSRFYCAWVCHMATVLRGMEWLRKKLKLPNLKTPSFMYRAWIRWGFLILALGGMIISKRMGLEIEMLLIITLIAVGITLIFHEKFFHNIICPFGTILSLSTQVAKHRVTIDEDTCIVCGKCEPVCPAGTIETPDSKKRYIDHPNCLVCSNCIQACPVDAIDYKRNQKLLHRQR